MLAFEGTAFLSVGGLFDTVVGRHLPENGTVMDVSFIRNSLKVSDGDEPLEVDFIPERLFIRQEMETGFNELLQQSRAVIFSGSAGIGKSVLLFLIVMYRVWKNDEKAIYYRMVDDPAEFISAFAMQRCSDGKIEVQFARNLLRSPVIDYYNSLREAFEHIPGAPRRTSSKLLAAVDGPKSEEFVNYSKLKYGCTSGAGFRIKHQNINTIVNVVMGAWTRDALKSAVILLLHLDTDEDDENSENFFDYALFDEIYYVNGGRIRGFVQGYEKSEPQKEFADLTVSRISQGQAQLSLSHSDCRSTDDHVDSLRSMFRVLNGPSTDSVNLHVDSQYMLRRLKDKLNTEEIFSSYKKAELDGNKGAQANYFEEMMHSVLCRDNCFVEIDASVRAQGSGVEGVKELTQKNQYWIPSVPNFVNIDSALVDANGIIWCFQFTIQSSHTFIKRRLGSKFLNHIPVDGCSNGLELVFVVPLGTNFNKPDTGGEASTRVKYVNCASLSEVIKSAQHLLTGVTPSRKRSIDGTPIQE